MTYSRVASRTSRLIATRHPTIGVFDGIAENEGDLRVAFDLEQMTNGRLQPLERLRAIPDGEIVTGPTASIAMAAFLHSSESGSRFNDGRLGAWYAATETETAIAETVYHNGRRLRASADGFPNRMQMRELVANMDMDFLDVRGGLCPDPAIYHPTDYTASQAFGVRHRWPIAAAPVNGIVYDSVRRTGGTNVCVFRPTALSMPIIQGNYYDYVWDAAGEVNVLLLTPVPLDP